MSTKTIELDPNLQPGLDAGNAPPEPERNAGPFSNPQTKYWLAAGVILVALVSVLVWLHYHNRVSTDDAEVDSHLFPVASKAYGSVAEVLVNDNQKVKAGEVLVKLDPRDLQARVDQARAALALAESQSQAATVTVPLTAATTSSSVAAAEADLEHARLAYNQATTADLAYAQANVEKSQATADRARADLERMRPLAAKAEISALQFDSYVAASRVADSELKADQEKLAQAQKNAEISRAALAAADARLAEARANEKQVTGPHGRRFRCEGCHHAGQGQPRSSGVAVELHDDCVASRRRGVAAFGGTGPDRTGRTGAHGDRAARQSVRDGEFQRDAARERASGPEG